MNCTSRYPLNVVDGKVVNDGMLRHGIPCGEHALCEGSQSQLLIKVRDLKKCRFDPLHILSEGLSGTSIVGCWFS